MAGIEIVLSVETDCKKPRRPVAVVLAESCRCVQVRVNHQFSAFSALTHKLKSIQIIYRNREYFKYTHTFVEIHNLQ